MEYIQLLIESEKKQAMEGWSDHVNYLEEAKQEAELISIMKDVNNIDHRIADEKTKKKKPGWEGRVEKLDQVKRTRMRWTTLRKNLKSQNQQSRQ